MAVLGRLQPFVVVTQSIAFAMPAKGSLRPETVIGRGLAQCPLADQKADIRANCCGAERSLRRLRQLCDLEAEAVGRCRSRRLMTQIGLRAKLRNTSLASSMISLTLPPAGCRILTADSDSERPLETLSTLGHFSWHTARALMPPHPPHRRAFTKTENDDDN